MKESSSYKMFLVPFRLWLVDCVHNFTSFSGRSHLGAYLDALFALMAFVLQVHEQVKFPEACIASKAKQMKK